MRLGQAELSRVRAAEWRARLWSHKASQQAFVELHNMMVAPKR